jgi:hypothetical protein
VFCAAGDVPKCRGPDSTPDCPCAGKYCACADETCATLRCFDFDDKCPLCRSLIGAGLGCATYFNIGTSSAFVDDLNLCTGNNTCNGDTSTPCRKKPGQPCDLASECASNKCWCSNKECLDGKTKVQGAEHRCAAATETTLAPCKALNTSGISSFVPAVGSTCDDGDACTVNDVCDGVTDPVTPCGGTAKVCNGGDAACIQSGVCIAGNCSYTCKSTPGCCKISGLCRYNLVQCGNGNGNGG